MSAGTPRVWRPNYWASWFGRSGLNWKSRKIPWLSILLLARGSSRSWRTRSSGKILPLPPTVLLVCSQLVQVFYPQTKLASQGPDHSLLSSPVPKPLNPRAFWLPPRLLNEATGSLLDDVQLVNTLQTSKITATEVTEQLETSETTEINIDLAREVSSNALQPPLASHQEATLMMLTFLP